MTQINSEIKINASKGKVWAVIADLGGIQNFHPNVKKSYYTSEERKGVGASRICEFHNGSSVEETATEWQEGESFLLSVRPLKKAPPFKSATARMTLREEGQETIAAIAFDYALKFGPVGKLMDVLLVRPQFRKVVPGVLAGLKQYAENGAIKEG